MARQGDDETTHQEAERLLRRIDKMAWTGRITGGEAERVRTATDPAKVDDAVREIRLRHAMERVERELRHGRMTQDEAEVVLQRLEAGEDPRTALDLRRRQSSPPS